MSKPTRTSARNAGAPNTDAANCDLVCTPSPPPRSKTPATTVRGADALVRSLELLNVDTVFAYPGGALLEISQALTRTRKIRAILPRHEQGGGFMAQGYARATGKPGVCLATSGPGAANLVTPIADAYMDSIPLIAITGQVFQQFIGKNAFQESDFFGMTLPIVKHSFLLLNPEDLPETIFKAFKIATTGRPGPVVIDIPKDVQQAQIHPRYPRSLDDVTIPGLPTPPRADDATLHPILTAITHAQRPVLYVGGGVITANATDALHEFARHTGIPVATTLMGMGAYPPDTPQSLYWFGMHGTIAGNWAVCQSDLIIALGTRFDDRITGAVSKFAPNAQIIHIDIDRSEHHKNIHAHHPVESDLRHALERLNTLIKNKAHGYKKPRLDAWNATIAGWKKQYPFPFAYERANTPPRHILPQQVIEILHEETHGNAIITTGVGQHQMWTPQFYHFKTPRTFISSLGAGTMGFGLPAAIGAKIAHPARTVIDIDGDGSFLMNIQELATAAVEKIPVKILILNNQHLGMVAQWEDRFYDGVRGQTILGDPANIGTPDNESGLYPDFVKIAAGFGIPGRRILRTNDLRDAIREMLNHDGAYLLDIVVPHTEHVLPFIPQGKSAMEILTQ